MSEASETSKLNAEWNRILSKTTRGSETPHRYDGDEDRCVCGGEITYYDGPERFGYGCDRADGPICAGCEGTRNLGHTVDCEES
jgi:hypothetical protein